MSKKGKKKGRKSQLPKIALATAILNLLIAIVDLISKIID